MTNEELIKTAKQLISIPSTADNPAALKEAVDLVASLLEGHTDITVERFEENGKSSLLAYYGEVRPERFDVLLNAHLDVVPAHPEQFAARLEGNKLFGRGSYDMKVSALVLTDLFRTAGRTSPHLIGLQIVTDEEVGGENGVVLQAKQGVDARFVVSGEMTDLRVCNETRGLCWVDIHFKGVGAHGGYAWDGSNAVVKASTMASALLAKFPLPDKQEWQTTANISAIMTENNTYNRVPDNAILRVDFRFTPEDPIFDNKDTVRAFIAQLDPEVEVTFHTFDPGVKVDEANPYLRSFLSVLQETTGKITDPIRRYGSSDARHFAARGIPCIEFGLSGKGMHGGAEYVDLDSIAPFKATIQKFLHNPILSGQPTINYAAYEPASDRLLLKHPAASSPQELLTT